MLFEKYRVKKALKQFRDLKDYGCYRIPCTRCKYLIKINDHWFTCERERLMGILIPKYKEQVDEIEKEFWEKQGGDE